MRNMWNLSLGCWRRISVGKTERIRRKEKEIIRSQTLNWEKEIRRVKEETVRAIEKE